MNDNCETFVVIVEDSNVVKVMKAVPTNSFKNLVNVNSNLDVILTDREKDVLRLITEGKSNVEIAKDLIISVHTAKAHVCSILQKLCVNDRVQAAVKAVRKNLVWALDLL